MSCLEKHSYILWQFLAAFFDGICGSVVGVIAIVAMDIFKSSVGDVGRLPPTTVQEGVIITSRDAVAAVLYILTLGVLYRFTHKYVVIFLVIVGALAGQFLFV